MRRNALVLAGAAALIAGLAGGAWHGWREGWIPTSVLPAHPLAPLPENFLAAIQAAPAIQTARVPCIWLPMRRLREVDLGRSGLMHVPDVAGLDAVSLPETVVRSASDVVKALDLLVGAGIYRQTDGEYVTQSGERTQGRTWSLTTQGWAQLDPAGCLHIAPAAVDAIQRSERVAPDAAGRVVYSVTATTAPHSLPAWLMDPAYTLFVMNAHDLAGLRKPGTVTLRLVRTDSGWAVEPPSDAIPDPTPAEALAAVPADSEARRACIRLPDPSTDITLSPAATSFTLRDVDPSKTSPSRLASQLMWQSRMSTLVRAGAFIETRVPATPGGGELTATQYGITPAFQRWHDPLNPFCLAMGNGTLEVVSIRRETLGQLHRTMRARARFLLRLAPDAWALDPRVRLPEAELVRELGGLPVQIDLGWNVETRTWTAVHEGRPAELVQLTTPPAP